MIGCMPKLLTKYAYVSHFIFSPSSRKVKVSGDKDMPDAQKTLIRTLAVPMADSSHHRPTFAHAVSGLSIDGDLQLGLINSSRPSTIVCAQWRSMRNNVSQVLFHPHPCHVVLFALSDENLS
jgi:hypothetical protein